MSTGSTSDAAAEQLVKKVAHLEKQVQQISDENDYLLNKVAELTNDNASLQARLEAAELQAGITSKQEEITVPEELLRTGNSDYAEKQLCVLEKWHPANIVCVRVHPSNPSLVASGGVDKSLRLASWAATEEGKAETGASLLGQLTLVAPVLCVDFVNRIDSGEIVLLASCMDGSHHVVSFERTGDDGAGEMKLLHSFKDHTKFVVRIRTTTCGNYAVTASHDKSMGIYRFDAGAGTGAKTKLKNFYFNGCVETLDVVTIKGIGGAQNYPLVALSIRDDNYLHLVRIQQPRDGGSEADAIEKTRVNMNDHSFDNHVSFTVLDLCFSPSGRYLLAGTDMNRHIVFDTSASHLQQHFDSQLPSINSTPDAFQPSAAPPPPGTEQVESGHCTSAECLRKLRNLYGHKADSYSQPRVAWDPSEKYVYSNSQGDTLIYVWCLASENVVMKIEGHSAQIRDLQCLGTAASEDEEATADPSFRCLLATASYDKSVRVWGPKY